jgi:hypothetical protein
VRVVVEQWHEASFQAIDTRAAREKLARPA